MAQVIEVEFIPDSDFFTPMPGRAENDFPGRFRDYCDSRGLDPATAALDDEVEYSPKLERAIKARLALRKLLEK
ncbi:MAG: hypothetical protein EON54_09815 [Alcaligenaceae bacterium]|nr:MAG: hypothetical protein EON54_09815 [Alcaligenaceae bacterium]